MLFVWLIGMLLRLLNYVGMFYVVVVMYLLSLSVIIVNVVLEWCVVSSLVMNLKFVLVMLLMSGNSGSGLLM